MKNNALGTAEAVAITAAVVYVVTAGLLLCVLLTRCQSHCHNIEQKRDQEAIYEDIVLEKRPTMELQTNEAYGHISHT